MTNLKFRNWVALKVVGIRSEISNGMAQRGIYSNLVEIQGTYPPNINLNNPLSVRYNGGNEGNKAEK